MVKWWAALLAGWVGAVSADPRQLVVLVQSGHVSKDVVKQFEQQSGVSVALIEYADEQQRDIMLTTTADQLDLVELDGTAVSNYNALNLLQAIKPAEPAPIVGAGNEKKNNVAKPASSELPSSVSPTVSDEEKYGVPYIEGAVGIAWREDLLTAPVMNWSRLFEQAGELAGTVLMPDDPLKAVAVSHLYMGQPLQSISASSLRLAHDVLRTQAPFVFYHSVGLEASDMLVTGEASVAVLTSTDAELLKKKFDLPLKFTLPEEGCVRWSTYWSVLSSSKVPDIASEFIHFITQPQQALANSAATGLTLASTHSVQASRYRACQRLPAMDPEIVKSINSLFFNLRRIQ